MSPIDHSHSTQKSSNSSNNEHSLNQLYTELEGRKISGNKQLAMKILGVALIVTAVAVAVFSMGIGFAVMGLGYGALIIALPGTLMSSGVGVVGSQCLEVAGNEKEKRAQRALKHPKFLEYANNNTISLTTKNIYKTIHNYKTDERAKESKQRLDNELSSRKQALVNDI